MCISHVDQIFFLGWYTLRGQPLGAGAIQLTFVSGVVDAKLLNMSQQPQPRASLGPSTDLVLMVVCELHVKSYCHLLDDEAFRVISQQGMVD